MARVDHKAQQEALRPDVLEMSEFVFERCETALKALEPKDASLAESVIDGDRAGNICPGTVYRSEHDTELIY